MKLFPASKRVLLLGLLLGGVSVPSPARDWASSGSPTPPPIEKRFKMLCTIDLGLVKTDAEGAQQDYEVLQGTLKLNNRSLDQENLARSIAWTRWDMRRGRSVEARLADLRVNARITEASFSAMGDGEGRIGSFSVALEAEMDALERGTRIGVRADASTYLSEETRGTVAKSEASLRDAQRGIKPSLEISCALDE